jgi:hypothetical protein
MKERVMNPIFSRGNPALDRDKIKHQLFHDKRAACRLCINCLGDKNFTMKFHMNSIVKINGIDFLHTYERSDEGMTIKCTFEEV